MSESSFEGSDAMEDISRARDFAIQELSGDDLIKGGFILITFPEGKTSIQVATAPERFGAAMSSMQATMVSLPSPYRESAMNGFAVQSAKNKEEIKRNAEAQNAVMEREGAAKVPGKH